MAITIPKKALQFLKKIEKNNTRDWFNEHKLEYKALELEVKQFYSRLENKMQTHDDIDRLKMYRIYRDVRFSKDKTPYNAHFSGYFSRRGAHLRGSYYLKIKPNNKSIIGVGFWGPSKEDLLRIRKEFEIDATEIRAILSDKHFIKTWGNFVGDEVKSAPRNFDKTHPNIDLIKKKQYIFIKQFSDTEVLSSNFSNQVNDAFHSIRPFLDYMSTVLTTDLNGVSLLD